MYYVYILKSLSSGRMYTGFTRDLRKRLSEHRDGHRGWTAYRRPHQLIYYEACLDERDAKSREIYLKSGMGKRFLRNRLKRFLSLTG
ncbi:GIY-YIG nuclease family protein [Candidatus Parcubacteria bacterium]|nr:MAG: GIY-YIG nuclease family protein [Candidatus Parcubacteria bacterium]